MCLYWSRTTVAWGVSGQIADPGLLFGWTEQVSNPTVVLSDICRLVRTVVFLGQVPDTGLLFYPIQRRGPDYNATITRRYPATGNKGLTTISSQPISLKAPPPLQSFSSHSSRHWQYPSRAAPLKQPLSLKKKRKKKRKEEAEIFRPLLYPNALAYLVQSKCN